MSPRPAPVVYALARLVAVALSLPPGDAPPQAPNGGGKSGPPVIVK